MVLVQVGNPALTSMEVLPAAVEMFLHETAQLRAFAHLSDGTVNDVTQDGLTSWTVDDPAILHLLSIKGLVYGHAAGTAHADACFQGQCAHDGSHQATVKVSVP